MIQGNARCNLSALSLFTQSLDHYENSLPANIVEPAMFTEASRNLEMGLNRLITSNPSDSYQMMRLLMERILDQLPGYSSYMLLMVATASPSGLFKDYVMTVVHPLLDLVAGKSVAIDDAYFAKLGRNEGIKAFLTTYASSDLCALHGTSQANLVVSSPVSRQDVSTDEVVHLTLGEEDIDLTLTGGGSPLFHFTVSPTLVVDPAHRSDKPTVITATVLISPRAKSFGLDKTIRFTEGAAKALQLFGCTPHGYSPFGDTIITVPGNFFACQLDVFSLDSGKTWKVGNVIILPPMRDRT